MRRSGESFCRSRNQISAIDSSTRRAYCGRHTDDAVIAVGRRNQTPEANCALLFKAPREAVGLFIWLLNREALAQRTWGVPPRVGVPARPLKHSAQTKLRSSGLFEAM